MMRTTSRAILGTIVTLPATVLLFPLAASADTVDDGEVTVSVSIEPTGGGAGGGSGAGGGTGGVVDGATSGGGSLPVTGLGAIDGWVWLAVALLAVGGFFLWRARFSRRSVLAAGTGASASVPMVSYAETSAHEATSTQTPAEPTRMAEPDGDERNGG